MKIFITILISTIALLSSNIVKTKNNLTLTPLVCVAGHDYSYLLEQDGYDIVSKEVDFNSVGTYYVTYLEPNTKELLTRRVDVIDEQDFTNDIYYRYDKNELVKSNYEFVDACSYENRNYLLEVEVGDSNKHNLIITEIINCKIAKQKIIKNNIEATFNKILVDDEGIYILGTVYKEGYSIDLYTLKVDFDLNLLFESNIGGSGVDNLNDAILYGEYIYLVGDTTSSGGLFPGVRKEEDGFVMKITKDFFNVDDVCLSTLNSINTYQKLTIKDDCLYILEQYASTDKVMYNLQINSLDLKIVKKENFVNSFGLTPHRLVSNDLGVFLLCNQYNYMLDRYATRIYQVTTDAKPYLYYDYANSENESRHVVDVQYVNNNMVLLTYDFNSRTSKLLIKGCEKEEDIVLNVDVEAPYKFISDNTFLTSTRCFVDYIYIKKTDDEVLINNEKVKLSDNSIINTNANLFGSYQNTYIYETNKLMFVYNENIYVPLETSVINNETFDNHLCLTFNGKGLLNNTLISSGYIIDKVGNYQLEVFGKDNERKIYNFKVEEFSNKDFDKKEEPKLLEVNNKLNRLDPNNVISFGDNIYNEITKTYHFWLLLIPVILLVVSLILIFRRKHEK